MSSSSGLSQAGSAPLSKGGAGKTSAQQFAEAEARYADKMKSMTMTERALLGLPYLASEPPMVARRLKTRLLLKEYNHETKAGPSLPADHPEAKNEVYNDVTNAKRREILQELFGVDAEQAARLVIEPPFWCDFGTNITFEGDFYCNFNTTILDCAKVFIGHGVGFGPGVHLYAATHSVSVTEREQGLERALPISIGRDTWVGGHVTIMAGITIGRGCTIGGGAVVTRDIPDFSVAVGNPARVVKTLSEEERGGKVGQSAFVSTWDPNREI